MGEQVEFYVLGIEYKCLPVGLLEMAHRQGALPSLQPIRLKVLAVDAPTSARFLIEAVTAASTTPIDLSQLEELKFDAEQDSIVNVVLPMVHPGKITITGPYRYAPWCAAALIIFIGTIIRTYRLPPSGFIESLPMRSSQDGVEIAFRHHPPFS